MVHPIVRSTLPRLPTGLAFACTRVLASIPPRLRLKERDREALASARPFRFGRGRRAWSWGQGPLVILVHGWGGRGAQLAPLARQLADQGFEAVVFDVAAHGDSPGRHAGFDDFIADLAALTRALGRPVHAYVGHSAGGLCLMAARAIAGLRAPHYVCLAAPRAPYVPIDILRRELDPPETLLARFRRYYAAQFQAGWDELDRGQAYVPTAAERLLLVYDHDDTQVPHADGDLIRARWPAARLVKTRGLGHHKLLWDARVMAEVAAFIDPRAQAQAA